MVEKTPVNKTRDACASNEPACIDPAWARGLDTVERDNRYHEDQSDIDDGMRFQTLYRMASSNGYSGSSTQVNLAGAC